MAEIKTLISVITVVKNRKEALRQTILSVIEQNCECAEHIIIDGASDDGSAELIEEYANKFSYWVSEPDNGIYHAMNKGIAHAKGDWLIFLNAGDLFYAPDTLSTIFNGTSYDNCNLIYGKTELIIPHFSFILEPDKIETMLWQKPFVHQSSFTHKSVFANILFDENYRIIADYKLFRDLYLKRQLKAEYVDTVVSIFDTHESISVHNNIEILKELYRMNCIGSKTKLCLLIVKDRVVKIFSALIRLLTGERNYVKIKSRQLARNPLVVEFKEITCSSPRKQE
jgi:glycosyltransferase involved in cell wall biosynthesis